MKRNYTFILEFEAETKEIVKAAHKVALSSADPDPASIYDFVLPDAHVSENYPDGLHNFEGEPKKLIEGLNETLKAEFRHNPDTFIWGQDIANKDKGGIFNVSKGLHTIHGESIHNHFLMFIF